jgi:hypothetical protein
MAKLTGFGQAAAMPTSQTVGTSVADPALGSRWVDSTTGYEYVVVDCQQAFVAGEFVYIDHANLATRLVDNAANGRVGVIVAAVSASDTKAFAQIYGLFEGAPGTSGVATSKFLAVPAGTSDIGAVGAVNTSDAAGIVIHGAYAVTATDSATTSPVSSFVSAGSSATIYIGFSVWLNYPYVVGTNFPGGTS